MKHLILISIFFLFGFSAFAQKDDIPTLPGLLIETKQGANILSWVNTYDGLKSVLIQRSSDSVINFATIGNIPNPRSGVQTFTDPNPKLGKNFYKVRLLFQSELEWFSNTYKVVLDSATIAASRMRTLSTGSTNASETNDTETSKSNFTDFYYEPSTQVYTNPYTGHIIISLNDVRQKRYSLRFYNPDKEEVLYISRIKKSHVVLDKYNFNARGTYFFKLFESDKIQETGYVTIY